MPAEPVAARPRPDRRRVRRGWARSSTTCCCWPASTPGRPLAREPVDLTRLVLDAVTDARAAGPDHRWRLDLPEEPVTVTGDAHRLHQVLANLLANARTHTPAGTNVTTTLTAESGRGGPHRPGRRPRHPAGARRTPFDRFARGDAARARAHGSTGLGLAIAHGIATAHDGTLTVTSTPGRGTAFLLRLPAG